MVMHRFEQMVGLSALPVHMPRHHSTLTISLEAVALAGLLVSVMLWTLVAMATPLPGLLSRVVQQKLPSDLRERFSRHAQHRA